MRGWLIRCWMLCLAVLLFWTPAWADDQTGGGIEHDVQSWNEVTLELPVTEKVRASMSGEPRFGNDLDRLIYLELNPRLDAALHPNVSVGMGYLWSNLRRPDTWQQENRLQQYITFHKTFSNGLRLSNRNQIEERFFEGGDGTVVRVRHQFRGEYPIKKGPWFAILSNETFYHLNSASGRKAGLDQNRLFTGVGRKFGKQLSMEGGYQFQYVNVRGGGNDQIRHILLVRANAKVR